MTKAFIADLGETVDDAWSFECACNDLTWCEASDAAEWFHDNRDGWECKSIPKITLVNDRGEQKTFTIEREMMLFFTAIEVQE